MNQEMLKISDKVGDTIQVYRGRNWGSHKAQDNCFRKVVAVVSDEIVVCLVESVPPCVRGKHQGPYARSINKETTSRGDF